MQGMHKFTGKHEVLSLLTDCAPVFHSLQSLQPKPRIHSYTYEANRQAFFPIGKGFMPDVVVCSIADTGTGVA